MPTEQDKTALGQLAKELEQMLHCQDGESLQSLVYACR